MMFGRFSASLIAKEKSFVSFAPKESF